MEPVLFFICDVNLSETMSGEYDIKTGNYVKKKTWLRFRG